MTYVFVRNTTPQFIDKLGLLTMRAAAAQWASDGTGGQPQYIKDYWHGFDDIENILAREVWIDKNGERCTLKSSASLKFRDFGGFDKYDYGFFWTKVQLGGTRLYVEGEERRLNTFLRLGRPKKRMYLGASYAQAIVSAEPPGLNVGDWVTGQPGTRSGASEPHTAIGWLINVAVGIVNEYECCHDFKTADGIEMSEILKLRHDRDNKVDHVTRECEPQCKKCSKRK